MSRQRQRRLDRLKAIARRGPTIKEGDPPSLARLAEILERTEREREAEGLPPALPDETIDRAWLAAEQAYAIAEQRERDRERADSDAGAIVAELGPVEDEDM